MRDLIAAAHERTIVYDGGMGATLEQFDLSLERDYRLPGPLPRGARPQPPRRDRGRARVDAGGRRRRAGDRHLPGVAAEARRVGHRGAHARDQPQGGADRPPRRRRAPVRGRRHRPDRLPARPATTRRSGGSPSPSSSTCSPSRPPGCSRAASTWSSSRPPRTSSSSRPRCSASAAPAAERNRAGADPVQRLAAAPGRQDAAGHRHQRRAGHARGARRRRDRPELLHRPRGHARRDPLPGRVQPGSGPLHPQRRPAAAGSQRRDDLPRAARAAGRRAGRVRRALRRLDHRRLLRHHARSHPGDGRARARAHPGAASGPPRRRTSAR